MTDHEDQSARDATGASDRIERRGVMAALELSHPLLWFDADGWLIDMNGKAADLLELDPHRPVDVTFAELARTGSTSSNWAEVHWQRIASGRLTTEERSIFRRDGTEIWCNLTHAAVLNADGSTRRVLTLIIDLSPWSWRPKSATRPST